MYVYEYVKPNTEIHIYKYTIIIPDLDLQIPQIMF